MSSVLGGFSKAGVALGAAGFAMALSGCGLGTAATSSSSGEYVPSAIHVSGSAHGGQQPLYNSTIQLWSAGTTVGYGQGATALISSSVKTLADGTFSITGDYTCPTPDPQVYLTATGGNPTGDGTTSTNNSNIQLVAALGSCSALAANATNPNYYIQVNEVTTAAAAFALAQFYGGFGTTTDQIGTSTGNVAGLTNAFATAHNLASTLTGTAAPTAAASGTNFYLTQNDNQKLNTIANILADCVNQATSNSAVCNSQFAYVTPKFAPGTTTAATTPVNTFQAAVYMNLNPLSVDQNGVSNVANLFNMQSGFAPFASSLAAAPTDWTLALNYTGTGISLNYGVAVDSNGDIWMSNGNTVGGAVMLNGGTGVAGGTAGVTGGVIGFYTSPSGYSPLNGNGARSIAIDSNNKAWFSNFNATGTTTTGGGAFMCGSSGTTPPNGYYLFRAASTGVDDFVCFTSVFNPYAISVSGNTVYTSTTTNTLVYTSVTQPQANNITTKSNTGGSSGNINLVFTPQIGSPSTTASFGLLAGTSSSGSISSVNSFTTGSLSTAATQTVSTGNITTPYGAALDRNGNLWVANNGTVGSNAFSLTVVGTPTATPTFTNYSSACLQKPGFIAVDGFNNIWVTNQNSTTVNGTTQWTVCEFDASGNLISNTAGFNQHGVNTGRSIAIDRSGNVWVTSATSGAQQVTQIVGAAAPVVTPLVAQINSGTNKVGIRP